jgi:hypothetical protein
MNENIAIEAIVSLTLRTLEDTFIVFVELPLAGETMS